MKLKTKLLKYLKINGIFVVLISLFVGCNIKKNQYLTESICVTTADGCTQIIKRGIKLPTSYSETFSTMEENQEDVKIELYQGEDVNQESNRLIGSFDFPITQPSSVEDSRIQITIIIDESKKLTLTSKDLKTGRQEEVLGGVVN